MLDDLKAVPALGAIVQKLMTSPIIITDLGINTATPATYQFGFYVRLSDVELLKVKIAGFGVIFTYEAESGNGELETLPAV
jgi:hypothetical protein